ATLIPNILLIIEKVSILPSNRVAWNTGTQRIAISAKKLEEARKTTNNQNWLTVANTAEQTKAIQRMTAEKNIVFSGSRPPNAHITAR
ncbi:hypothetical protein PFISCL1PPCAC_22205, partial [Pristionchus fissidentatus]